MRSGVRKIALLDGGERSADARADTDVLAYGIAVEELRRLPEQRPHLMTVILGNIVRLCVDALAQRQ